MIVPRVDGNESFREDVSRRCFAKRLNMSKPHQPAAVTLLSQLLAGRHPVSASLHPFTTDGTARSCARTKFFVAQLVARARPGCSPVQDRGLLATGLFSVQRPPDRKESGAHFDGQWHVTDPQEVIECVVPTDPLKKPEIQR